MISSTAVPTSTTAGTPCGYCGLIHLGGGRCPSVKAIEYYPNGTVKRVEFVGSPSLPAAVAPAHYPGVGGVFTMAVSDQAIFPPSYDGCAGC